MEVIFDTTNLRPVLSPTMRTTLSVISLIANSLIEANKCMKERLADEAGQATTLDQVMQQSGLKIPGLEEALARLMGGGPDAKQAAAMVVNTPDPVKLLQAFATQYGFATPTPQAPAPGPIVTPPPAANTPPASFTTAPSAPQAAASGPRLAPFRPDFTREAREAAKAAAASPSSPGLPQFRQDFTAEARQAAQAHGAAPVQRTAPAQTAEQLSLVSGVVQQLDTIRRHRKSHEEMVQARLVELEAELARLREEFDQFHTELLSKALPKADGAIETEGAVSATTETAVAAEATISETAVADEATIVAPSAVGQDTAEVGAVAAATAAQPSDTSAEQSLPPAATAEEVVEAIGLIEQFAVETKVAEAEQLKRIAAAEQEVARMRSVVQSAREAQVHA